MNYATKLANIEAWDPAFCTPMSVNQGVIVWGEEDYLIRYCSNRPNTILLDNRIGET